MKGRAKHCVLAGIMVIFVVAGLGLTSGRPLVAGSEATAGWEDRAGLAGEVEGGPVRLAPLPEDPGRAAEGGPPPDGQPLEMDKPLRVPRQDDRVSYAPGEVIVKFKPGTGEDVRLQYCDDKGLTPDTVLSDSGDLVLYRLPDGMTVTSALRVLVEAGVTEYVQPNYRYRADALAPDDPYFDRQWGLESFEGADLDILGAWDHTQGSSSIIVAVIDTGVDIYHPELARSIWVNSDEIPDDGIDNDDNGYADDYSGWDFYNGDNTVFDDFSNDYHGTHVAGTIAAEADNGIGVAGAAPV